MLTATRHKTLLVLGLVLFALVMACGGGASEADIEATVEARVAEERALFGCTTRFISIAPFHSVMT